MVWSALPSAETPTVLPSRSFEAGDRVDLAWRHRQREQRQPAGGGEAADVGAVGEGLHRHVERGRRIVDGAADQRLHRRVAAAGVDELDVEPFGLEEAAGAGELVGVTQSSWLQKASLIFSCAFAAPAPATIASPARPAEPFRTPRRPGACRPCASQTTSSLSSQQPMAVLLQRTCRRWLPHDGVLIATWVAPAGGKDNRCILGRSPACRPALARDGLQDRAGILGTALSRDGTRLI